jgi:hypothetical protein
MEDAWWEAEFVFDGNWGARISTLSTLTVVNIRDRELANTGQLAGALSGQWYDQEFGVECLLCRIKIRRKELILIKDSQILPRTLRQSRHGGVSPRVFSA